MFDFSEEELKRYSRHILLQDVGIEGQEKIRQGKVLIVGAGGLGSPVAFYLAAAGVGTIGLIDYDVVDYSNLQRQILHSTNDIDRPKVISAKEKLEALNPNIKVNAIQDKFCAANAMEIIKDYDFVVDATDNFSVKFLINDACVMAGKPFSHGGVLRFEGETLTYKPGHACYRCVFGAPPPANSVPSCSQAGVLGSVAGMLGTIQATEVLKYLTGAGDTLVDKLMTFDAKSMDFRKIKIFRNDECPICGTNPSITKLADYEEPTCKM